MPEADRNRLQEEAIRRAREMQSRARFPSRPREREQAHGASSPEAPPPVSQSIEAQTGELQAGESKSTGLLDSLFQDKERTVILALLILLGGEDGNHELMFALLFLLM